MIWITSQIHHGAATGSSRNRLSSRNAGGLALLPRVPARETPLWRKGDASGASRYRFLRPAASSRQALPASRAELHPVERGEPRTPPDGGGGPNRSTEIGLGARLLGVKPVALHETPRPGSLSRPNPTADLAGALQRGKHQWLDATASPHTRPSASPRSPSPASSSPAAASAWPHRPRRRQTPNGIRWRVVSPVETGPSTPATAITVGCSSPPVPGLATAAASSRQWPTWPAAKNRSRSPRRCWPPRVGVPGRCVVAGCRVRHRAP